jgi:hypothetical protein
MNFHPSVGLNSPGPTTPEPFAPEARYELKIDRDGDAVANISYEVRFASVEGGEQAATLCRVEGAQAAETGGGKVIVEGVPVSTGHEGHVTQAGDHRFFAGWRSDPFFFDVLGTLNKFQFTSGDFFAGKDTCSIVVGLWARTLIPTDSAGGGWIQADREARPNQTPFLPGEQSDAYLAGEPADDVRFVFVHALEHAGGYPSEEAKRVAGKLLPDLLRYDPKRPASFPDKGRGLIDDVF